MFTVLRLPGALRAFLPALLGRLALAMAGLSLVLATQSATGSFALAGAVSAVFGLANVLAAPWRARAVDRWGQRPALGVLGVAQALGLAGLALAASVPHPSVAWFLVLSVVIGLGSPPLGAAMRVIWASLTSAGAERNRAMSLDATAEELLFVGGPVLAAAISTAVSPSAALFLTAGVALVGTLGLTTSAASGARRAVVERHRDEMPLRIAGFVRVLVVLLGVGVVLGTVEIVAPAAAIAHDAEAASGWMLGAFSAGSAIGGLVHGHLAWQRHFGLRLVGFAVALGAVTIGIAWIGPLVALAVGLGVAGLFLAPSMITGYLVADHMVPEHSRTEASTWINTAVNLGAVLASAGAGVVVDGVGPWLAMVLAGAAAIVAAAVTPVGRLRHERSVPTR